MRFPGFSGEWEETSIGNVVKIGSGKDYKHLEKGNIPVFGTGGYMTSVNDYLYDGETVFIGRKGTIDKPFWHSGKFWTVDTLFYTFDFVGVLPKFLYSIFQRINWKLYNEASGVPSLSKTTIEKIKIKYPSLAEQEKISSLLSLLDERIATQNKIINDLKKLKSAIIDSHFNGQNENRRIGDLVHEISNRNKRNADLPVLSVSNRQGFIAQSEQFENRVIASDDTSKYKIVVKNDFAYNPARINVGSIARLVNFDSGIVSPMYVCFRCSGEVLPDYLELFFQSRYFKLEVEKRLEGSVRQCLSIDGIKSIQCRLLPINNQKALIERLKAIQSKLNNEETIGLLHQELRQYLLSSLFI